VRASSGLAVALRCRWEQMQIDGRYFEVAMPKQDLDGAQVGAGFQHVSGKTMPAMYPET